MKPYKHIDNWDKRVYISGKMRGLSRLQIRGGFNRAFNELVVKYGCHPDNIISPDVLDRMFPCFEEDEFLELDLFLIRKMKIKILYLMSNWKTSEGAKKEKALAEELGLEIWYQPEIKAPEIMPRKKK